MLTFNNSFKLAFTLFKLTFITLCIYFHYLPTGFTCIIIIHSSFTHPKDANQVTYLTDLDGRVGDLGCLGVGILTL